MNMDLVDVNSPSVSLSVSTTTASVALGNANGTSILIDNTGIGASTPVDIYVKSGLSDVVATTSDMHIAAGEKGTYKIDPSHTHIAGITASGSTTARFARATGGV
jgi:hypothetical protein